jgi:hypothetical protein
MQDMAIDILWNSLQRELPQSVILQETMRRLGTLGQGVNIMECVRIYTRKYLAYMETSLGKRGKKL